MAQLQLVHCNQVGDIGEKTFELECFKRGIDFWVPSSSNTVDVDYAIVVNGQFRTVQVKATSGPSTYDTGSKSLQRAFKLGPKRNFDILACYCMDDNLWWITDNIDELPTTLKIATPKSKWNKYLNNWSILQGS